MSLSAFAGWLEVHPTFTAFLFGPILMGLFSFLFKQRDPLEYAAFAARNPTWFFARVAAFWVLLGKLGIDPEGAVRALFKVITGRVDPPKLLAVSLLIFGLMGSTMGCGGAAERSIARGAVLTAAEATHALDTTCADTAVGLNDLALAKQCAAAYSDARLSLISVASAVDAWDRSSSNVTCALVDAAKALQSFSQLLANHNVKVPPIAEDAVSLIGKLGSCEAAK